MSLLNSGRRIARALHVPPFTARGRFLRRFHQNLASCTWEPHPRHSVFSQFDRSHYLKQRAAFEHKYRCFYAVSKTIQPERILEIGCAAGSSADAYLSATPSAEYIGFDWYESPWWLAARDEETGEVATPRATLEALFTDRGFERWRVVDVDLRSLQRLPVKADMVVVDAAHDFENEYADLKLALTAEPTWIWVDDVEADCERAVLRFLEENRARVEWTARVEYLYGGGIVIKLKSSPH